MKAMFQRPKSSPPPRRTDVRKHDPVAEELRQLPSSARRHWKSLDWRPDIDTDDHPESVRWAASFCYDAHLDGHVVDLEGDTGNDSGLGATVRLITTLWPYAGDWSKQTYRQWKRSRHTRVEFLEPYEWSGARLVLTDLWNFAFSHVWMATNLQTFEIEVTPLPKKQLTNERINHICGAVLDGMRYDFEDEEFEMAIGRRPDVGVVIAIGDRMELRERIERSNYRFPRRRKYGVIQLSRQLAGRSSPTGPGAQNRGRK